MVGRLDVLLSLIHIWLGVDDRSYEWRTDPDGRWRDAFHNFGHLLLTHARDRAINSTRSEHQDVASAAATDALYNLMMILEGVVGVPAADDLSLIHI